MMVQMSLPPLDEWMPPQQRKLLAVLCADPDKAGAAFEAWSQSADWQGHFDRGSFRLLPDVYRRIESLKRDGSSLGRLRGLYRRSWYVSQRVMQTWSQLHRVFAAAGIDLLLVGPSAMAAYRRPFGTTFLERADLLVRPSQADQALGLIREMGWTVQGMRTDERGGADFVDAQGQPGRLQWGPLYGARASDPYWADPVSGDATSCPIAVPGPSAMLVDLLSNLHEREPWTVGVLLADLRTLIAHQAFDWHQAVEQAGQYRLTGHLHRLLECLHAHFGTPIPERVLAQLKGQPESMCEWLEWRLFCDRQLDRDNFLAPLRLALARYLRRAQGMSIAKALALLPDFLRQHYGTKCLHQVAGRLLRNGVRRSLRSLGRSSGPADCPQDLTRTRG